MPLPNRVDPFGDIHAVSERGLFMGNRGGCFHRPDKTLKDRRWTSKRWIICVLSFKERRRALMQPGLYTELFFLDEATALAGGHRPCFECRRAEATAFRDALVRTGHLGSDQSANALDVRIAGEIQNTLGGGHAREATVPASLPDGAMYASGDTAYLKLGANARRWSFSGYGAAEPLHDAGLRLTPHLTCEALRAGYQPVLHASSQA
jgi:hypothetical protein